MKPTNERSCTIIKIDLSNGSTQEKKEFDNIFLKGGSCVLTFAKPLPPPPKTAIYVSHSTFLFIVIISF